MLLCIRHCSPRCICFHKSSKAIDRICNQNHPCYEIVLCLLFWFFIISWKTKFPLRYIYILWYKLFIINYRVLHYTSNFHNWNAISKNGRDIKRWSILKHVKLHFRSIMVKWHIFLKDLVNASTICLKICQMFHI